MKAYWGSGGITHSLTSALDGVSGQLHSPAALPQGKSPLYPLDRRLGGPQSWSGRCGFLVTSSFRCHIISFKGHDSVTPFQTL
jgi:hypothetical protein